MKVAIVVDSFAPTQNSAAIQMKDLVNHLATKGLKITVFTIRRPSSKELHLKRPELEKVRIIRAWTPFAGSKVNSLRGFSEVVLPVAMLISSLFTRTHFFKWDLVICYSPSIFTNLFSKTLIVKKGGIRYLILRDIFPDWAVDLEIIRSNSLLHRAFNKIAALQFKWTDMVGVQSPANRAYLIDRQRCSASKIEVLNNWLSPAEIRCSSVDIKNSSLGGRHIALYAGNIGAAQGADRIFPMLEQAQDYPSIGFVFIGDGAHFAQFRDEAQRRSLTNVLFFDPIPPEELNDLMRSCVMGLVLLDDRHVSHNIPGKSISYLRAGLPVCAFVNKGNDLSDFLHAEGVGFCCDSLNADEMLDTVIKTLKLVEIDPSAREKCCNVFRENFSTSKVAEQILSHL